MSDPQQPTNKIQALEKEALARYNAGQLPDAMALLQQILWLDAKNAMANYYLDKVKKQLQRPGVTGADSVPSAMLPTRRHPSADTGSRQTSVLDADKTPQQSSGDNAPTKRASNTGMVKMSDVASSGPIKVLVVDDSSLIRKILVRMLNSASGIQVVGEAGNGQQAVEEIAKLKPDVVTLDVNMPVMDGLAALKQIIIENPLPVIMLSAFTEEGASTTFDCLTYGAVDFISKPSRETGSLSGQEEAIIQKITKASKIQVPALKKIRLGKLVGNKAGNSDKRPLARKVLVMGAGEGGCASFLRILPHLPDHLPAAVLAVQYMEDPYFQTFCDYLNQFSQITVKKAEDGEPIREGICYFTNQKMYLKAQRSSEGYCCQVAKKPDFLNQQNVVNHLLFSAAESFGPHSIGVLLAGKCIDGVEGIREIKRVRGITLSLDPKNCIAAQLPEFAVNSQCVDRTVIESDFPGVLWHLIKNLQ